jgi:hypothetical protein
VPNTCINCANLSTDLHQPFFLFYTKITPIQPKTFILFATKAPLRLSYPCLLSVILTITPRAGSRKVGGLAGLRQLAPGPTAWGTGCARQMLPCEGTECRLAAPVTFVDLSFARSFGGWWPPHNCNCRDFAVCWALHVHSVCACLEHGPGNI